MAKMRMVRQIILPFILIIIVSLIILTWFSFSTMKSFYLEETKTSLLSKAHIFKPQVMSVLAADHEDYSELQKICNDVGDSTDTRITVMLPEGVVIADSEEDPAAMDNHKSRPEMSTALIGEVGHSIRFSNTLQRSLMYLAIPLQQDGNLIGVLRMSVTTESINKTLNDLLIKIVFAVLVVALLAAFTAFVTSKHVSQPLELLRVGAERFALGKFDRKLPIPNSEEIAQLAESMNIMASELDNRIRIITRQKNEQEAILQSMIESVVAVDDSGKIIIMNHSAAQLFETDPNNAKGKSVYEIIRNPELQNIFVDTLKNNKSYEGEITLDLKKGKFIRYNSSILKGDDGSTIGTLLVLNDLTRIKYLENIRQDFVANVSHELRTPITSIKGFVETLLDNRVENKQDTKKFLTIVSKQVDRLNSIIEDLLCLSRIEQDSKKGDIPFEEGTINDVIISSIELCEHKAKDKNINVDFKSDYEVKAHINSPLLEQAIINLLDNAIKYSPENSNVRIELNSENESCKIRIFDEGSGIEKKHLDRLFERFYRVDKARSRELGGTGLGLAIVKHITLSHKGTVTVESELGKGSIFTMTIPLSH